MQASKSAEQLSARTFTEKARRAQVVRAAIETIAELGYSKASFAQIAKRAGLSSTGLISYHFASRDDLIEEVVREVLGAIGAHMANRLAGTDDRPPELLRSYILGNVEFISTHRDEMKALVEIFLAGGFAYGAEEERITVSPLERILRRGQREGTFRRFDVTVMATLIQRAIDGLPFLLGANPNLDVTRYGAEVATVFELATRTSE